MLRRNGRCRCIRSRVSNWPRAAARRASWPLSRRTQRAEQFLGFYDVYDGCLIGECRRRKTARDLLVPVRQLCVCTPRPVRLSVGRATLTTHQHPLLRAFYRAHRVAVVPMPTPAGSHSSSPSFGAMRRFTLDRSDEPSYRVRRQSISRYLTWWARWVGSAGCWLYRNRSTKLDGH
jgi:hypothetical protein